MKTYHKREHLVLKCLLENRGAWTLAELSTTVNYPEASVSGAIRMLRSTGFIITKALASFEANNGKRVYAYQLQLPEKPEQEHHRACC